MRKIELLVVIGMMYASRTLADSGREIEIGNHGWRYVYLEETSRNLHIVQQDVLKSSSGTELESRQGDLWIYWNDMDQSLSVAVFLDMRIWGFEVRGNETILGHENVCLVKFDGTSRIYKTGVLIDEKGLILAFKPEEWLLYGLRTHSVMEFDLTCMNCPKGWINLRDSAAALAFFEAKTGIELPK